MWKLLLSLTLCGVAAVAQNPEAGTIHRSGDRATLVVDHPRPLDAAAITLAEQFGIRVSVEDPTNTYPMGGRLEVEFAVNPDGSPKDVKQLLRDLVDADNAKFPFAYRLDVDSDWFTLVPTRNRDTQGRAVDVVPLLDRHVTIPLGIRSVLANVKLMTEQLSEQTGIQVGCCQSFVAGVPWGLREITYMAVGEPARSVLKELIDASAEGGQHSKYYWLERCDPTPPPAGGCFINLN